jgi:MarR family 2-MHQ and catechol resistance regulon transcriptional repressor
MPTHWKGPEYEKRALNTFIKLNRAVESLNLRLHQRGTQGDLTPSQFAVLEVLYHLGSLCQGEISAKILKSSGNMTMVIDNLEKRGFVRRLRDTEDRRQVRIELTDAGREKIEAVLPVHIAAVVDEMSALSPEEQDQLGELARKLGLKTSR